MKQWKVINHFLSKVFCFLCQWQYTLELTCFCEVKRKGRGNWRNLWQCRASEQLYLHSVLMQERPGMYWVLRKIGYFKFALMRVIHRLPPAARFLISNKAKFISKHLFYWHSRIDGLWSFCLTKEIQGTYLEYINGNWCLIWFVILSERMVYVSFCSSLLLLSQSLTPLIIFISIISLHLTNFLFSLKSQGLDSSLWSVVTWAFL